MRHTGSMLISPLKCSPSKSVRQFAKHIGFIMMMMMIIILLFLVTTYFVRISIESEI